MKCIKTPTFILKTQLNPDSNVSENFTISPYIFLQVGITGAFGSCLAGHEPKKFLAIFSLNQVTEPPKPALHQIPGCSAKDP